MKNLSKIFAVALLAIPMLSIGAADVGGRLPGTTQNLTTCCYVQIGPYLVCVPC